jgi:hypothetical protein
MARKTDIQSSQKWSDIISSSKASLPQNGFGLASPQHNSALSALYWPQTDLGYIARNLVTHLQLPPKNEAPKLPNNSQKWRKYIKNGLINHKTQTLVIKPTL